MGIIMIDHHILPLIDPTIIITLRVTIIITTDTLMIMLACIPIEIAPIEEIITKEKTIIVTITIKTVITEIKTIIITTAINIEMNTEVILE